MREHWAKRDVPRVVNYANEYVDEGSHSWVYFAMVYIKR